jgi:hypothetical protein
MIKGLKEEKQFGMLCKNSTFKRKVNIDFELIFYKTILLSLMNDCLKLKDT